MRPNKVIAGSMAIAIGIVLAFWEFALGGVPWLRVPGADVLLPGTAVQLLTYDGESDACYTDPEPLLLVPDPSAGTAIVTFKGSLQVAWPAGFVGRRVNDQVNVYSSSGLLVATTGKTWMMAASPNAENNQFTNPYRVGCASKGLTEYHPDSSPAPG
jgi:hypothetical protein